MLPGLKNTTNSCLITSSFPEVMEKLSSLLLEESLSVLTGIKIVVPMGASSGMLTVYTAKVK